MGGLATVITMILLPIIPERMFGYMYLGLTVPGLVGAIVIMWLFVGETRGLDLKTVTGTEWDKPKKVKEDVYKRQIHTLLKSPFFMKSTIGCVAYSKISGVMKALSYEGDSTLENKELPESIMEVVYNKSCLLYTSRCV